MRANNFLALPLVACMVGCTDPVADINSGDPAESKCIGVREGELGKYRDCSVVAVVFRDGSRCVATNGAGTICQWTPIGTVTTIPSTVKAEP